MREPFTPQAGRSVRLACLLTGFVAFATLLAPAAANAQENAPHWDLRVCADPDNLPYSNRQQEGFENAIVAILADELQAEVNYAWLPLPRREGQEELMLRMGACDVLTAVSDGSEPYLTTLAYYRSIAMFVTREDAPFEITSLDDPRLDDLRIGVQRGSPADFALVRRDMIENVHHFFASDPGDEILRQVADGTLDLGIVWGPIAGYHAQRLELPVSLKPVSPELDMPFIPMFQALSMALRSDDEALRDLLNRAMAARWEEIQQVLASYGVPTLQLPRPVGSDTNGAHDALRIGAVLPTLTGTDPLVPMGPELVGEPALRGAILAAERQDVDPERPLELLVASAPTAEAAERAARRLILAQDTDVLIGGLGTGQGEMLGAIAQEFRRPFLDIGIHPMLPGDELCRPTTFRVEASETMYLEAMASAVEEADPSDWFIVHTDTPEGEARYGQLARILEDRLPGSREAGTEAVLPDQPLYLDVFEAIEDSGAQTVILLLDANAQLVFLGQYETSGVEAVVHAFPTGLSQTRQYYAALAQDAPVTGSGPRLALWDASLTEGAELNDRFLGRWGRPMDPSAWAAYAAVKIVADSSATIGTSEPEELLHHLTESGAGFDLHKGDPLSFRAGDRQLVQPLYVVRLQPEAESLLGLARVAYEVPTSTRADKCPMGD